MCRKPCQTQVEKDIHSRATGHTNFLPCNSSRSLTNNPKFSATSPQQHDGASNQIVLSSSLHDELLSMGYSSTRSINAQSAGNNTLEGAIDWIASHENDPMLDAERDNIFFDNRESLSKVVTSSSQGDEKEQTKSEIRNRILKQKELKEEKDRIDTREREKQRIQMQKAVAEAKERSVEMKRKLVYEEMQRDKANDIKTREKLVLDMAIERKMKAGLDLQTATHEANKDIERRKKSSIRKEEPLVESRAGLSDKGSVEWKLYSSDTSEDSFPIEQVFTGSFSSVTRSYIGKLAQALDTLQRKQVAKILKNILQYPLERRFRKLNWRSQAFKALITEQCLYFLRACGFIKEHHHLKIKAVLFGRLRYALECLEEAGI